MKRNISYACRVPQAKGTGTNVGQGMNRFLKLSEAGDVGLDAHLRGEIWMGTEPYCSLCVSDTVHHLVKE